MLDPFPHNPPMRTPVPMSVNSFINNSVQLSILRVQIHEMVNTAKRENLYAWHVIVW